ncbi:hypothetical protein, partial [Salmonella enterica]|uniref:hypothetical protein n=1 Tax=Salmonella enterica TaxID=28901 RepID=UPI003FA6929E
NVPMDEAVRFTSAQIFELARFVDQVQPEAFRQIAAAMAENPACLKTLSGSLLLLALRRWMPTATDDRP